MKSLGQFKTVLTEEKKELSKLDMLVQEGFLNESHLNSFQRIINEMKKDNPSFSASDRLVLENMMQSMIDHVFDSFYELDEGVQYSSDFKLSSSGRKIRARRLKLSDDPPSSEISGLKEEEEVEESVLYSSDFKLSPSGRKIRARRFRISDDPNTVDDELEAKRKEQREKDEEEEREEEEALEKLYNQKKDPSKEKKKKKEVKEEYELDEATRRSSSRGMPPFTLVIKRKAIRQYPDNTKVALYWSDKLKRYISVPYDDDSGKITGVLQSESTELQEAVIDKLHKIVQDKQAASVKFGSGHTRKVDHYTASAITNVHKNLNDDNKKKFADMLHKSPEHFTKAAEFAFKHVK